MRASSLWCFLSTFKHRVLRPVHNVSQWTPIRRFKRRLISVF